MLAIRDDAAIDQAVETLKFLSDRNRLRILSMLARAETCVCDLIDALALPQPLVSYHLRKLRDGGLVRARVAPILRNRLDLGVLTGHADRIVPAVGRASARHLCAEATVALGKRLRHDVLALPGGHVGYATHPAAFADTLHDGLTGTASATCPATEADQPSSGPSD